jgi:hypothetical protein
MEDFMEWTKQAPLVEGGYWYSSCVIHLDEKILSDMKIVSVIYDNNRNLVALFPGVLEHTPIESMNGDWWGPLEPPSPK